MKSIALHILDIAQNSIRAGASEITIKVRDSETDDIIMITITDNGSGIPEKYIGRVTDPFFTTRTTRKTGFGLPLLKFHSQLAGGDMKITSGKTGGTTLEAGFIRSHIDRQPLGDLAGVITILAAGTGDVNIDFSYITDSGSYRFNTRETKAFLNVNTLSEPGLYESIKEMIGYNIIEISDIRAVY